MAFWCFGLSVLWNFGEKWLIIFFFGFLKNHCTVQKKDGSCEWRAAMVADAKTLYEWGRWASELTFWPMYYPPVNRRGSSLNSISLALLRAELALVQYIHSSSRLVTNQHLLLEARKVSLFAQDIPSWRSPDFLLGSACPSKHSRVSKRTSSHVVF